jgi:hypothetical protein
MDGGSMHKCKGSSVGSGRLGGKYSRHPAWHEELKQVASQYTADALALRFNVHFKHIVQLVRRYDLQVKPRSREFYRTPRRNVDVAEVLRLARQGDTSGRIAKQLGVSRKTIQRVCREHGVALLNKRPGKAREMALERVADMPPARSHDPYKSNRNQYGDYVDPEAMQEPEKLPVPTEAPPGTAEKVRILAQRVANNEQLWHELDRLDLGGLCSSVLEPWQKEAGKR